MPAMLQRNKGATSIDIGVGALGCTRPCLYCWHGVAQPIHSTFSFNLHTAFLTSIHVALVIRYSKDAVANATGLFHTGLFPKPTFQSKSQQPKRLTFFHLLLTQCKEIVLIFASFLILILQREYMFLASQVRVRFLQQYFILY